MLGTVRAVAAVLLAGLAFAAAACDTALEIHDANPSFAYTTVPTEITITGCNLNVGLTRTVKLLGVECAVKDVSKESLTCVTGSSEAVSGLGDIVMTVDAAGEKKSAKLKRGFMYFRPTLTSVHPAVVDVRAGATVRVEVTGLYYDQYEVSFGGIKAEWLSTNDNFLLVRLPALPEDTAPAGASDVSIGNAMLPSLVIVKRGLFTFVNTGAKPYVTQMSPSWAVGPAPVSTATLYAKNLAPGDRYNIMLGQFFVTDVISGAEPGTLIITLPTCTEDMCYGPQSVVLINKDEANDAESATAAIAARKDSADWEFTFLRGPHSSAPNVYPGAVLPHNYDHEMLVTFSDFTATVPATVHLGEYTPDPKELVVTANGFRFNLAKADKAYASGRIRLFDDAGNVVYDGGDFVHAEPDKRMAVTRVVRRPMEIGLDGALSVYGYGFVEHGATTFRFRDVLAAEPAAGAGRDVTMELSAAGLTQSRVTGYVWECTDEEDLCRDGDFAMEVLDAIGTSIGVFPEVLLLQFNKNVGMQLNLAFGADAPDASQAAVDAFKIVAGELLGVAAERFGTVALVQPLEFTVQLLPLHADEQPDAESLAAKLEALIADTSSELHKRVPGLRAVVLDRQSIQRCGARDYRLKCGKEDDKNGDSSDAWIYICIGIVAAALIIGLAIYACKKRADHKRAIGLLDEHYATLNN
jgi:hypothetical protein